MAAEIFIYDEIGPEWAGMLSASTVKKELKAAKGERVTLRINSPGGGVWEALAMLTLLKEHGPGVDVMVDGVAASAAAVLSMVGDSITMAEGSMMMVHNAMNLTFGNKEEHQKAIGLLDKADEQIAGIFASRTKKPLDEIKAMMTAETWLTGPEAVNAGFATGLGQSVGVKACGIKPGRYQHTPAALLVDELPREHERRQMERYYSMKLRLTNAGR